MNIKHICILFGITAWANFAAAASTPEDCAAITDDAKRLACYDQFFIKDESSVVDMNNKVTASDKKPAIASENKVQSFGKEQIRNENDIDAISSTAKGSFRNWQEGMVIELENEQSWKIIQTRDVYHVAKSPKVTIEKGSLGTYFMSVEGLNRRFKVKRVK